MANNTKALVILPAKNNVLRIPASAKPAAQPPKTPVMNAKRNYKKKNNKKTTAAAEEAPQQPKQLKKQDSVAKKQDRKPKPSAKQQQHQPSPQQRRPQVLPVKARRVERKRDIVSMTDALRKSQADVMSTSPVSSSGESENDSDSGYQSRRRRRPSNDGQVYCGPCFSNAPAPSALPMPPAFRHDDGVFMMDEHLQQQSKELMSLLMPRRRPSNIPATMKTAHSLDTDLSEIQRGLRSMLKMSS
ncbi:hypothetical protein BJV82DRAFT_577357 [Fennellomyces sp. T-0311]|nr:hypothetical protein BJV82DRAFT_577357 [Fennellomyces sp. T-0311]